MIVVGGGHTSVGKTRALRAFAAKNYQAADLEALAAHRGSVFGDLKGAAQPSNAAFETKSRLGLARARREARRLRRGRGGPRPAGASCPGFYVRRASPASTRRTPRAWRTSSRTTPRTRPRARRAHAPRRRWRSSQSGWAPATRRARSGSGRGRPRSVRAPAATVATADARIGGRRGGSSGGRPSGHGPARRSGRRRRRRRDRVARRRRGAPAAATRRGDSAAAPRPRRRLRAVVRAELAASASSAPMRGRRLAASARFAELINVLLCHFPRPPAAR